MPIENASWVIPAVKQGYDHRKELLSVWEGVLAYLLGQKSLVAITGQAGVGKTVLFEHLTGAAYERGHTLPIQPSPDAEEGKVLAHKKRIRLITVPGQETGKRYEAVEKAFTGKKPLAGILHVVANGYATVRSKPARSALQKQFNIQLAEDYRTFMLAEEIADLRRTCALVKQTILKHAKPVWLIVVSTKCDLYSESLDAVENYYSPYGSNAFAEELARLTNEVGAIHFSWDSAPVCASLEDFEWNGHLVASKLKSSQRDQLVIQLLKRVERNCAG